MIRKSFPESPAATRQTVAIWNDSWLPKSETFVRDHVESLASWRAITIGWHKVSDGIYSCPTFAPLPANLAGKIVRKFFGTQIVGRRLNQLLSDPSIKLIHAHFGIGGINALPFAKKVRKPLIVTFHGKDVTATHHNPSVQARYHRKLLEVFAYSTRLIAVSEFIASKLVELGAPASKIVVNYLGIPLSDSEIEGPRNDEILFVGRLVEKKGVGDLLEAVAQLPERHRGVPVRIVGFGPLLADLRTRAVSLGVNATFEGALSSSQVAAAMSQASLFVAPSKVANNGDSEGFGLVFLEAAAQGLPVVGYRHGGVGEAVESGLTGFLVAEGDTSELTNSIGTLLDNADLRRSFAEMGRARVRNQFDIQRCTAQLEQIYVDAVP